MPLLKRAAAQAHVRKRPASMLSFVGSERWDSKMEAAGLPLGPASIDEFAQWPTAFVKKLTQKHQDEIDGMLAMTRVSRLSDNLSRGQFFHSDFSGQRSHEACMRLSGWACEQRGISLPVHSSWLVLYRACDPDPLIQKLILGSPWGTKHLFFFLLRWPNASELRTCTSLWRSSVRGVRIWHRSNEAP